MSWNLRRSRKIAPGIRLNLSKKGLGISVGPKHSKISISPGKRVTTNIGIPGTGLRYTNVINTKKRSVRTQRMDDNAYVAGSESFNTSKVLKRKGSIPAWGVVWALSSLGFFIEVFSSTNPFGDSNFPTPNTAQTRLTSLLGTAFWGFISYRSFRKRKRNNILWSEQEVGYQTSGRPTQKSNEFLSSKEAPPTVTSIPHESATNDINSTFLTSRFNRPPHSKSEWTKTNADYIELARLVRKVGSSETDKSAAVEFPIKEKEVVFLKSGAFLTNSTNDNLDAGLVYVTNQRVSFLGEKQTCEWLFSNMTIFLPYDEREVVLFQNTDHPLVQGVHIIKDDFFKFQMYLTTAYSFWKFPPPEIVRQIVEASAKYEAFEPGKNSD